jgi:site-specific recombinase XerD
MTDRQMSRSSALRHLHVLGDLNRFAVSRGVERWDELPPLIEDFVRYYFERRGAWCRTAKDRRTVQTQARWPLQRFLELVLPGYDGRNARAAWPFQAEAPGFLDYLRQERGLRPETLQRYAHYLRSFQAYLQRLDVSSVTAVTPSILSTFILQRARELKPGGLTSCAGVLRVLLRYLHRERILASDLSRAVPRGRAYKQSAIPRAIPWSEVERVLDSIDRRSSIGKRDYAMLLLLATYGLRAQEVAGLTLDAIDWPRAQFHVLTRKAGNSTSYPLATSVGEAIIDYLRHARPATEDREVFLTIKAPYVRLQHFTVSGRASCYLHRAGIRVRRAGSHTFRHSCVQRLVDADVPFKQIGDYVGHRSEAATQVYAKVAIHKLRALTLGDAEEAL